ncbi:Bacteriophage lysis protein [compost metagenome]
MNGAVGYDVEWRKDNGNWIKLQRTGMTSVDVVGIYAGAYVARVRAVSAFDISSIWRNSILTNLKGKAGLPPAVSFLTATPLLFGIGLKWGFPAGGVWKVQDWRYGKQLAEQAGLHQDDLITISNAAATQIRADQDKRLVLEQRLSASEQIHYKELSDAQTKQARLRERLATADLRLSGLLDTTDSASGSSVPAATGAGGVVHGGTRPDLTQRMLNELSESPAPVTKD